MLVFVAAGGSIVNARFGGAAIPQFIQVVAIGVGGFIALAGMIGALVSGASMNTARSLGPAIALNTCTAWWVYLIGPPIGALVAVAFAYALRGTGGDATARRVGSGALG